MTDSHGKNLFHRNTVFLKIMRQQLSEQLLYETDKQTINEISIIISYLTDVITSRKKDITRIFPESKKSNE